MSYAPKTLTAFQSCLPGKVFTEQIQDEFAIKPAGQESWDPYLLQACMYPGDPFEPFEEAEYGDGDPLPWFTLHTSHPLPCG
jgi:hypothetical protein